METSQNYISERVRKANNTLINPATEEKQNSIIVLLQQIALLLGAVITCDSDTITCDSTAYTCDTQ